MCFSFQQLSFHPAIFLVCSRKIKSSHTSSKVDLFVVQNLTGFFFFILLNRILNYKINVCLSHLNVIHIHIFQVYSK